MAQGQKGFLQARSSSVKGVEGEVDRLARGKRTDPTAAVLAKVMWEMGFEPGLIAKVAGLPRGTVKDIIQGNGPWRQMPRSELYELTRLRLIRVIDEYVYDFGMKAMAKLEEKMKTASFMELINFAGVALNRGDTLR